MSRAPTASILKAMPRTSVSPTCVRIHARFALITAAADRDTIKKAIEAGATNYILKPINLAEARSRLATLFQGICARYSEDPRTTRTRMGMPPLRDCSTILTHSNRK